MSPGPPEPGTRQPAPVPRLLVQLPSWTGTFFGNLYDLIFARRELRLDLLCAPAPFWPDVFVKRQLPWFGFVQSGGCHVVAFVLLVVLSRIAALQPRPVERPVFDHAQVIYYQPSEYLPPLDTRRAETAKPRHADPEFSRQPIISVPPEADNRSQTIVAPPKVKLKRDLDMPNIVAWSEREKPRLEIPPVPLTPAAEITRLSPRLDSVVAPPRDVVSSSSRTLPTQQSSVVAPPPDISTSRLAPALSAPEPALIAPPPSVETASTRTLGDLNIGRAGVINPAPQLAVGEQRAIPGGRSSAHVEMAPQVVAPPPSLGPTGSAGAPDRVIALSMHPVVSAPAEAPAGNRRGSFAATPEGHSGASGTPGSSTGGSDNAVNGYGKDGTGSKVRNSGDLPSGLYVGNPPAKPSPVAGDPEPAKAPSQVNSNVVASVAPPRVASEGPLQPGNPAKLTETERAIFADRKFYSLTLNMPNLNSGGGSWVIRFAELKRDGPAHGADTSTDLSGPRATRKVDPAYPMQLMHQNVAGTVLLYAVIHADGTVGNVRILRSVDERLDRFAAEAVSQWKFDPATKNGTPVDVEATFQIPFKPARAGSSF